MDVLQKESESGVSGTATNGTATATLAAPGSGFKWRVTHISGFFSGAAVATPIAATLVVGGVTFNFSVSTNCPLDMDFGNSPVPGADNATAVLSLGAGGVGAVGAVNIHGYKVPTLPATTPP